ncbi:DNA-directed RNA polymerase subunit beta [Bacillus canaveralius]|uniref:DNA-directed RNA polymerase subunit beta n=1 Tax=Bacillus canaveralius TaxID=1403243 RepID=A0A2N5GQD4_9BACI|nr:MULTISPECIES: DNA-directed RNA polymerase subunit beta [Bacillus]PLR85086.1 DNA-directed RNA polymerase subunit beta [Bacillus canaveralius]PLR85442.1 DNA-directed RNA polymerase subunit beta [Bacillus sp. V33-4]PLS00916.1 DNA-directed RNA polymerase subunit beta [Bacillus canaveralius]
MSLNKNNQEPAQNREQVKKDKKKQQEKARNTNERVRTRLIPIWLRVIVVILLIFVCLVAGAMIGYGVIGNGKATDVFKESTWTHIADLINGE